MGILTSLDRIEKTIQDVTICLQDERQPLDTKSKAFSSLVELFQSTFAAIPEEELSLKMDLVSITLKSPSPLPRPEIEKLHAIFSSFTSLLFKADKLSLPHPTHTCTFHSLYEKALRLLERSNTPSDVTCSSEQVYTPPIQELNQSCTPKPLSTLLSCTSVRELYEALDSCLPVQLRHEPTMYFILKNHGHQSLQTILEIFLDLSKKEIKKDPKTEHAFEDFWVETYWMFTTLTHNCWLDEATANLKDKVERKTHSALESLQNPIPKLKWLFVTLIGNVYLAMNLKAPFPAFFSDIDRKMFTETTCEIAFHELIQKLTYDTFKASIHIFEQKIQSLKSIAKRQHPAFELLFESISRMIAEMKQTAVAKTADQLFEKIRHSLIPNVFQERRLEFSDRTLIVQVGNNGTEKVKRVYQYVRKLEEGSFKIVELVEVIESLKKEEIGTFNAHARPTDGTIDRCKKDFFHEYTISEILTPHSVKMILAQVSEQEYTLTMPYFNKGSLRDVLIRIGHIQNPLTLAKKIAENLQAFHERELLHLDIKPGNVLLKEEYGVIEEIITDYGFVEKIDPSVPLRSFSRMSYGFYPPEMFFSSHVKLDPSLDVWSLGLTLYILTHPKSTYYPGSKELQYLFKKSMDKTFKTGNRESTGNLVKDLCLVTTEWIKHFKSTGIIDELSKYRYLNILGTVQKDEDRPKIQDIFRELYLAFFRINLKELQRSPHGSLDYLLGELLEEDPLLRKPLKEACEELSRLEQEELKKQPPATCAAGAT